MNITLNQNEDTPIVVLVRDKQGPVTEVPTAAEFGLYDSAGVAVFTLNLCGGVEHDGNAIKVSIPAEETESVAAGGYRYEIWAIYPSYGRKMLKAGRAVVNKTEKRIEPC